MDGRVLNSLPGLKNVSHCGTIVEFVRDGRRIVSVPGSNSTCSKLGIDKRGRKNTEPVYYTSKALRRAEGRYPSMEKLAFAFITASRKLRHYFQVHVINVMTDHLLKKAMNKLEAPGRLIQWAVELSEFDI